MILMKKALFLAVAMLFVGNIATARKYEIVNPSKNKVDGIYKLEGDASVLRDRSKKVCLEIDFSNAKIVEFDNDNCTVLRNFGSIDKYNKDHGQEYVENWPAHHANMTATACSKLKNALGASFQTKQAGADYKVVVRIGQFDFGHFAVVLDAKAGGTITKGLIEVYDSKNKLIAVYDINYLRGTNIGYGNNDRIREWGKNFAKEFKKALK